MTTCGRADPIPPPRAWVQSSSAARSTACSARADATSELDRVESVDLGELAASAASRFSNVAAGRDVNVADARRRCAATPAPSSEHWRTWWTTPFATLRRAARSTPPSSPIRRAQCSRSATVAKAFPRDARDAVRSIHPVQARSWGAGLGILDRRPGRAPVPSVGHSPSHGCSPSGSWWCSGRSG